MPLIEEISSTESSVASEEEPEEEAIGGDEKSEAKEEQIVVTEERAAEAEGEGGCMGTLLVSCSSLIMLCAVEKNNGNVYFKERKYEAAIVCYSAAISANPGNACFSSCSERQYD